MSEKIRLGVSACLLGQPVRYNGGHKRDPFIVEELGRYVEFVPVCPEVEAGFPVPRETFRLVGNPESPRFVTTRTGKDFTDVMTAWAEKRAAELEREDLCGYIFKTNSPSSGMERVKVYSEKGTPARKGVGVFARAFMRRFPLLPVIDEGRLHDAALRENFIESLFTLRRWRDMLSAGQRIGRLVQFHAAHKLLLMAHSPERLRQMGALVARAKGLPASDLFDRYQTLLLETVRLKATVSRHCNVLQHIAGYFRDRLSAEDRHEVLELIEAYRQGHVPLIVPVTLIAHHVRRLEIAYLRDQVYLHPHPLELKLRNHV